jgi:hypothetical protein
MKKLFVIFLLCPFSCLAQSDRQWALDSSTLSYHISHPLSATSTPPTSTTSWPLSSRHRSPFRYRSEGPRDG